MMTADEAFEAEVLRVARALFAKDRPFQGSAMLDGAERDGVFVSDEAVTVVEATTSRREDKARKDGTKLDEACETYAAKYPYKAIKGFFVTQDEPTAQQRAIIQKFRSPLSAVSLAQLRSRLVDSHEYLSQREEYPFGSARNPLSGDHRDLGKYIEQTLLPIGTSTRATPMTAQTLKDALAEGKTCVLVGDYGAGKSMALRQIHQRLSAQFKKGNITTFPLTLNLRDHQGQMEPDEAIRRHASRIGFESPNQLIRAWRAGNVTLLLDGFDEVATSGWLRRALDMKQIRRASLELVRRFVSETPAGAGLLITGRRYFFDSLEELKSSLGLRDRRPIIVTTDQLTDDQVAQFMSAHEWEGQLPEWLPSRPLLLGYLASSRAIDGVLRDTPVGADEGWNILLASIAERESRIELGLDGEAIRRVIERLATLARSRASGVGPLHQQDLAQAFESVCGYPPDEGSYVVLQRLPGLGIDDFTDGARFFIDDDFVDAARAGDIVRYATVLGSESALESIQGTVAPMRKIGVGVASWAALSHGLTAGQLMAAAAQLQKKGATDAFVLDCLRTAASVGDLPSVGVEIRELEVDELAIGDGESDLGDMQLIDCIVHVLDLTEYEGEGTLPVFVRCEIGTVLGAGGVSAMPADRFVDCNFGAFDPSAKTTRGIMAMPGLTLRQKVLLSVLKKIYVQAGSGRKESALLRGLDGSGREQVPNAIQTLLAEGMIVKSKAGKNTIYSPVRGRGARVRNLLEAGTGSSDSLLSS